MVFGGRAGDRQKAGDPLAQTVGALGLRAGDEHVRSRPGSCQRLGEHGLVLAAVPAEQHERQIVALAVRRGGDVQAVSLERQEIRPKPLNDMKLAGKVARRAKPLPGAEHQRAGAGRRHLENAGLERVEEGSRRVVGHGGERLAQFGPAGNIPPVPHQAGHRPPTKTGAALLPRPLRKMRIEKDQASASSAFSDFFSRAISLPVS